MATFNDKAIVDELIAADGFDLEAPQDPRVIKVVEYTPGRAAHRKAYGVVYLTDPDPDRYERPTEYVVDPKVIWYASEQCHRPGEPTCPNRAWRNGYCGPHQRFAGAFAGAYR